MTTGPDFTRCGKPVNWSDNLEPQPEFIVAIDAAALQLGVDIELCRWSVDSPLSDEYTKWWTNQRTALRRHIVGAHAGRKATLSRRTDKGDGSVVCYVRFNRTRPTAVREVA